MSNITAFPLYHITNIPESLRQLANRIEHGEIDVKRCVVCIEPSEGDITYTAFGCEPFTKAHAIGLCFAIAASIL